MKKGYIIEIIVALLIIMFLYAAFSKFFDLSAFTRAMHNQPFPYWFSTLLVWVLPVSEILIACCLILERSRTFGLYGSVLVLTLFTSYIIAILFHVFPRVPCSCGGIIRLLTWKEHLLFNLFFLIISISAVMLRKGWWFNGGSNYLQKNDFQRKS